jgi:replicative DNA helicase
MPAQKLQESGKKSSIAFFSLEMSSEQLSTRIISEQARISSNDIRRGRISDEQFDKFSRNLQKILQNFHCILMRHLQLVLQQ